MNRSTSVLLVAGVVFLPLGWVLVLASGYGGNSTGGSEIVWRIGGLMVYASFSMLLLAALIPVARLVVSRRAVAGQLATKGRPRQPSVERHSRAVAQAEFPARLAVLRVILCGLRGFCEPAVEDGGRSAGDNYAIAHDFHADRS